MRASRFLIGSVSSIVWPVVVLLIPMGITFAAARVYAEGAPMPLLCTSPRVTTCAAKGEGEACDDVCPTTECGCYLATCRDGGPIVFGPDVTHTPARFCADVLGCSAPRFTSCAGKSEGAACDQPVGDTTYGQYFDRGAPGTGVCVVSTSPCFERTNNVYGGRQTRLDCHVSDAGAPPGAMASGAATSNSDLDAGQPAVNGVVPRGAAGDDSGCASSPGSVSSAFALLGAPLALGLLLARRRRKK